MKESKVQSDIKTMLNGYGVLVLKMQVISLTGFPDLFCAYKGVPFFIEVKTPGNKPRALQYKRLQQLTFKAGLLATWFDNVDDAEVWFKYEVMSRVTDGVRPAWKVRENICRQRYGKLTVMLPRRLPDNTWAWECICDCGKLVRKRAGQLKKHPSCGCSQRIPIEERGIAKLYGDYRGRANRTARDFTLTMKEFGSLILQPCSYCGDSSSNCLTINYRDDDSAEFMYTGIDRVDNEKDYISENCVPCCSVCNSMKGSSNVDDFLNRCERISERGI